MEPEDLFSDDILRLLRDSRGEDELGINAEFDDLVAHADASDLFEPEREHEQTTDPSPQVGPTSSSHLRYLGHGPSSNNPLPLTQFAQAPCSKQPHPCSATLQRFATPKTEQEIQEARTKGNPKKTLEDTKYCVKVRQDWCNYQQ